MGNNLSVDHEQPDVWWPPPHAEVQPEQPVTTAHVVESCTLPKTEASIALSVASTSSSTQHNSTISESFQNAVNETPEEIGDDEATRRRRREAKLQQFKSELEKKHLARREAIAERSREIIFLREELAKYRTENEQLKDMLKQDNKVELIHENIVSCDEFEKVKLENYELKTKVSELSDELRKNEDLAQQNSELRKSIAATQKDLQAVNSQVLEFEKERQEYHSHVVALKDVIRVSKKLLEIRENQLQELKSKVSEIEASLAQREASMLSTNLREEYERQLRNIRALRTLYEQRQAAAKAERDILASQLSDAKNSLEDEQKKNSEFEERVNELEIDVSAKYDNIKTLESQLGLAKAEYRGLEAEMTVINQLFSQILFGFHNCQEINFDKLIKLLQENHDLLTDIVVNEESQEISSALPKVLLDLVNQVNEEKRHSETPAENAEDVNFETSNASTGSMLPTIPEENTPDQQINQMNSAEEIVTILPKVWRVLIELLRQQSGQQQVDINDNGTDPCYKSVQTPKGPKLVLSVSQTFIRLKDLILEKKSLEKEMSRLKQLNTHLEVRLQDQEKRLETVSTELSKTWHVVGRMQRQHQQLHTHEKILRYELAQKRKMLNELKQELEYCREKWEQAREKNTNTEEEWRKLRTEFASRKVTVADDINNSAESGYSDERECSSDDEPSYSSDTRQNKLQAVTTDDRSGQTSDTDDNEVSHRSSDVDIISQQSELHKPDTSSEVSVEQTIVENSDEIQNSFANLETQSDTTDVNQTSLDNMVTNDSFSSTESNNTEIIMNSSCIDTTDTNESSHSEDNNSSYTEDNNSSHTEDNNSSHSTNKVETEDISSENTNEPETEVPINTETNIETNLPETKTDNDVQSVTNDTKTCEVQNSTSVDQYNALLSSSVEIENALKGESSPGVSTSQSNNTPMTQDDMLSRREARLKRLEEQCQQLVNKVTNTTQRSTAICNRLEILHDQYATDRSADTQANEDDADDEITES